MGEELDYCSGRNVGDAGNASIAHVSLEAVCTGKVGFFMDLDCQMRNERGKE